MKITSKHGTADKIHIYIDGEYTLTLYDWYWHGCDIDEGSEISEDELASLKEEAGFRSAYEKGVKYLSLRAYSEKELFDKLKQKFGSASAERAMDKIIERGYTDDESYAKEYSRYLFNVKKYDIKRVATELKIKGIDPEIADKTLKTLDNSPILRIIEMLRTKFENKTDTEKERKRLVNRFIRMGYSYHDIKAAFEECELEMPTDRHL